jgi:hypothetical protein
MTTLPAMHVVVLTLFVTICELAISDQVLACACCADEGERKVLVERYDFSKRELIDQLQFDHAAELVLTDAGFDGIKGIASPSDEYDLRVHKNRTEIIFALGDKDGHVGSLVLRKPASISVFEIDLRDGQKNDGGGPRLYKEWKLSSTMTGTGVFKTGASNNQFITLIIHGHGNHCDNLADFTHWTLVINGPLAVYSLIGELKAPP